jgi:hypothetical protein
MQRILIFTLLLFSAPAFAGGPPTVTLTQDELTTLIESEIAKALSNMQASKAKGVYEKINAALNSKPASNPTPGPAPDKGE